MQRYVIAQPEDPGTADDGDDDGLPEGEDNPVVIAETTSEMDTLSVSEAVMRLDLSERSALVFLNAGNGRMNVIYRRRDGNIGWVDPEPENATA